MFGQNLNLMCVLHDVYISGRPWPTAIINVDLFINCPRITLLKYSYNRDDLLFSMGICLQ